MLEVLPANIVVGDTVLHNFKVYPDRFTLVKKLVWYRNMFRHSFGNTNPVTKESTTKYIENIIQNSTTRVMYAIEFKGELIGVYGINELPGKRFLLDHAMRFSPEGDKNLFSDIGKRLVYMVGEIDSDALIFIAIKTGNKFAEKAHNYGFFAPMESVELEGLNYGPEIELKKFVGLR